MTDQERFEAAKQKVIGIDRQRLGIGTLSEKTVHAILKCYYEPDPDKQEIPLEQYVADIYSNGEIIEIQTRQFDKLRKKLEVFLPLYKVTVIYPIPREKRLIWIDEESGEMSAGRRSPKRGTAYLVFPELYKIKSFLKHENLCVRPVLLDMEEYRLLNGWSKDKKKGSTRYDRIPTGLVEEVEIEDVRDYLQFVPYELEEPFTVKAFAKAAHIPVDLAGVTCHILNYLEVIRQVGKSGNAYLYQVVSEEVK